MFFLNVRSASSDNEKDFEADLTNKYYYKNMNNF